MGIRVIKYYEISCDYPEHVGITKVLGHGTKIHILKGDGERVICDDCWSNKMTLEVVLQVLGIEYSEVTHSREYKPYE